ncbi:MAG: superoxide dismutase, Ni [Candidatus Sungbacteria bacterium]|nr:superoxide dismutase, Ni [Candidatus Sungbacteria bacterium]
MTIKQYFSDIFSEVVADAHCDIPCGVYDPTPAKIAARTVARMVQQLGEIAVPKEMDPHSIANHANMVSRRIAVKEAHAEMCKKELLILWSDFFKAEHLEQFPDLHALVWDAVKLCSKNKQEVNADMAQKLVEAVDALAKIFYVSKKVPERYEAYQTITDKLW